jgi:hypothetical protein
VTHDQAEQVAATASAIPSVSSGPALGAGTGGTPDGSGMTSLDIDDRLLGAAPHGFPGVPLATEMTIPPGRDEAPPDPPPDR